MSQHNRLSSTISPPRDLKRAFHRTIQLASLIVVLGILCLAAPPISSGQNFSLVPGEVINYIESPVRNPNGSINDANKVFVSSPSITVLPNGDYIVSHDIFGDGTNNNISKVFRSTDQGITWTEQATITDAFASTIFYHDGALYLWGYRNYSTAGNADVLIRKSIDNGVTWTTPTNATNGLLLDTNLYGQANTPAIYNNRIWIALAGTRVMSAPVTSNLLLASSWTASDSANMSNNPWGTGLSITEAQVAASPAGVVVMPKVDGRPNAVVIRVTSPEHVVNFAAPGDYIDLPGGEKKFALQYDSVSQKYYILSNPNLPVHLADPTINDHPELIRNTAALLSSKDLRHWDMEKIFLYSPETDHDLPILFGDGEFGEAFQYMNFAIEGDDMLVVSRTAFDTDGDRNNNKGERLPPKGHDSNLITFHRIEDFRTATPSQEIALSGNKVIRRELTQYLAAPLGNFTVGSSFAGAPINQPDGFAQDSNGDVYIHEQGGRILRFDALGNFYNTVAGLPSGLSLSNSPLSISQPAPGERSWVAGGTGTWDELTNWYYWGRPDTNYEIATLGSAIASNTTITMNGNYTFKGLRFRNSNSYIIDGPGEITLSADSGHAVLDVQQGIHRIANPVTLYSDTDWNVAAGARLFFQDALNLNGQTLTVTGPGQRNIDGAFLLLGGKLVTDGQNQISFSATTQATLNGTLEFVPYEGASLELGATHSLFNGMSNIHSTFTNLVLPQLGGGLKWDTSSLYVTGVVSVVGMLGDYNLDGTVDAADYVVWRDTMGSTTNPAADGDRNGVVDEGDYAVWKAHFGMNATGSGQGASVIPEPRTLALVLLSIAARAVPSRIRGNGGKR